MDRKFKYLVALIAMSILVVSCTTKKKVVDDEFAIDSAEAGLSTAELSLDDPSMSSQAKDEFSEFENGQTNTAQSETSDLEKELTALSNNESVQTPPPVVETPPTESNSEVVQVPPAPVDVVPEVVPEPAPVVEVPPPADSQPIVSSTQTAQITHVEYKGNNNGGAFVVTSDVPLKYNTRINSSNNQIIVEVENAVINPKYTRALNTKDMSSSIDYINIYQKKGTKTARFVIQLRQNAPEPLVQPEGNSLLIVGSLMDPSSGQVNMANHSNSEAPVSSNADTVPVTHDENSAQGVMGSDDLEAFLANSNKYYGKKISIEVTSMDVRNILKFISEESGVNMVFDDDVSGETSMKLRKVPWDQALITVLKSKKLGYRRQGDVLRISKTDTLIKEDEAAIKLKEAKATVEPIVVKNFSINYADIKELEAKIKEYITSNNAGAGANRGRVTGDARTNTLIVAETATKLKEIDQLITALDTQPQQVMIESKIIEAEDSYLRNISGILNANRLKMTDVSIPVTKADNNLYGITAGSQYTQEGNVIFGAGVVFDTLGSWGVLNAQLNLDETEKKIKILSSPRIAVLTNTAAEINQGGTVLQQVVTKSSTGEDTISYNSIPVGVVLKVTPQISNIGTVRLKLDVSRTAAIPQGNGATTNRKATTEVIVKNGDTAVIGGVFTSDVNSSKNGVPGLKDIPILGTLFKGESNDNKKNELMIFVTPKIIPLLNVPSLKADASGIQN